MASKSDDNSRHGDCRERIDELKRRAGELNKGEMVTEESSDLPDDVSEKFWQGVVDYEEAPWTTNFQQLIEAGVELPAPEALDEQQLSAKLWEVIEALARRRVFLSSTDHLSDRVLYTMLWKDALREETKAVVLDEYSACHLDLVSGGSDEDNQAYLRYYADEAGRKLWAQNFPQDPLPAHENPPYDRDRHLPKPDFERGPDGPLPQ